GGPVVQEIEVIRRTRSFLLSKGLCGSRVLDLYTDAHPTLTCDRSLEPFQRFTLAFEGFSAHPDLAGRLDDGETTFAVEVKGQDDLLRGIALAVTTDDVKVLDLPPARLPRLRQAEGVRKQFSTSNG